MASQNQEEFDLHKYCKRNLGWACTAARLMYFELTDRGDFKATDRWSYRYAYADDGGHIPDLQFPSEKDLKELDRCIKDELAAFQQGCHYDGHRYMVIQHFTNAIFASTRQRVFLIYGCSGKYRMIAKMRGVNKITFIGNELMYLVDRMSKEKTDSSTKKKPGQISLDEDDEQKEGASKKAKAFQNVLHWGTGTHQVHAQLFPSKLDDKMLIEGSDFLKSVATSKAHSMFLTSSGKLYSFGANHTGQLGTGNVRGRSIPRRIKKRLKEVEIKQVACAPRHTVALDVDGNVYVWGDHRDGRLGLGPASSRVYTPTKLAKNFLRYRIMSVSCGSTHTVLLRDTGAVHTFGGNLHGQLGHGDEKNRLNPHHIKTMSSSSGERDIKKIADIKAGSFTTLLLTEFGEVLQCGFAQDSHDAGYLTVPTVLPLDGNPTITKLGSGMKHSIALADTGAVYTWGDNRYGQLGIGEQIALRKLPRDNFDDEEKKGAQVTIPQLQIPGDPVILEVAAGHAHTLLLSREGKVYAFGRGTQGQLGHGSLETAATPIIVPKIKKTILGIVAAGDQSYAIEGVACSKLGTALWGAFLESQKNNTILDVCIKATIEKDGESQQSVYCHGIVLSSRSKYLRELILQQPALPAAASKSGMDLLNGETKSDDMLGGLGGLDDDFGGLDDDVIGGLDEDDSSGSDTLVRTISLGDLTLLEIKCLLEFLYTDTITYSAGINTDKLLKLSEDLQLPRLTEIFSGEGVPLERETLAEDMDCAVGCQQFSDVSFFIEGQEIYAHKGILACRSEYFQKMLYGAMAESQLKGPIMMPPDIKRTVFLGMLKFIYTDRLEVLDLVDLVGLWGLAHQYNEKRLFSLCENTIQKSVDEHNIISCLKAAIFYSAEKLERFCKNTIAIEMDHLVNSEEFKELSEKTQKSITKLRIVDEDRIKYEKFLEKAQGENIMSRYVTKRRGSIGRALRMKPSTPKPHEIVLKLNIDDELIEIISGDEGKDNDDIQFSQIVDINSGISTPVLEAVKDVDKQELEDTCFSIISHMNLNVKCKSKEERDEWVMYLKRIVNTSASLAVPVVGQR